MSTCTFSLVITFSREWKRWWASSQLPSDSHHPVLSDSQKVLPRFLMRSAFPWSCKYWTSVEIVDLLLNTVFWRGYNSLCPFKLLKHIISAQSTDSWPYSDHLTCIAHFLNLSIAHPPGFLAQSCPQPGLCFRDLSSSGILISFLGCRKYFGHFDMWTKNPEWRHSKALGNVLSSAYLTTVPCQI